MNRVIVDVETAGTVDEPLVYDFGFAVVDNVCNVIATGNYVISDVFYGMAELMQSAYYANKLPQYHAEIATGTREVVSLLEVKEIFKATCQEYGIKQVWAYNARFDRNALNHTCEVLSNGFCKWFTPYGVEWKCIQGAACSTILNSRNYFKFAVAHDFVSPSGNVRTTAESAYSYLINNADFQEAHTGLEDVQIENEILAKCLRQHRKMDTKPSRAHYQKVQPKFKMYVQECG